MSLIRPHTAVLLFSMACQQSIQTPAAVEQQVAPAAVPTAPAVGPQTTAQAPSTSAPDKTPKLTRNPDGTLRLQFLDRWGKPFDATYESAEFLKRAVPVVSRGMTEEQAAHLENQVTSLR